LQPDNEVNERAHATRDLTMTTICERVLRPSMSVSSCETMRRSTSPLVFSRFGAMASTSSMKMIAGASATTHAHTPRSHTLTTNSLFSASSNALLFTT
jgi:hypothetical protein